MPRPVTVAYRVSPTPAEVAQAAARLFASAAIAAVEKRGRARIAISGGTTPKAMFALLADPAQPFARQVPWQKLDLYWVDERCVPPTDPDSNYRMTNEALLSKVSLPQDQVHRMEGELDPAVAAARYESVIRNSFRLEGAETPTFDLILLGMGDDGHTASLFPHTEALSDLTDIVTANHVPQKDTWRITLTWPVINQGREVAFLIEGAAKAQVLHDVFLGQYQPDTYPSQIIRPASGKLTLLLDAAAAAKLPPAAVPDNTGTLELK
ncbi:6-phosphogluconolactonase [Edaphobacter acidisoli]|uniref:6-phosphogluconolactonase n=1 Tax=Edaphobacter acidisoli TaxID=2040573 RepID=A0A916W511_9BACT|nr:6-phosphogluconolactonase [Edaphobacter acidisoli]GGA66969.1 6-phosphogluconolactonase [Edaphobacter acidisoli]